MGVYIKGMEMPTSCADCPIGDDVRCALMPGVPAWWAEYDKAVSEKRMHSHCPLVSVPKHGDLIDRDAILRAYELSTSKVDCSGCKYKNEVICQKYELCEALNDAPTIIPAEPPKEET